MWGVARRGTTPWGATTAAADVMKDPSLCHARRTRCRMAGPTHWRKVANVGRWSWRELVDGVIVGAVRRRWIVPRRSKSGRRCAGPLRMPVRRCRLSSRELPGVDVRLPIPGGAFHIVLFIRFSSRRQIRRRHVAMGVWIAFLTFDIWYCASLRVRSCFNPWQVMQRTCSSGGAHRRTRFGSHLRFNFTFTWEVIKRHSSTRQLPANRKIKQLRTLL